MSAELQPVPTPKTPTFCFHIVQLKGSSALIGAEQVTWRIEAGMNVVAGGNSSGKSLLCSAIRAAVFPDHTKELQKGLASAGLEGVTIVGQSGAQRREWHLSLKSGELSSRPRPVEGRVNSRTPLELLLGGAGELPELLPHIIVNGAWPLPDRACLRWAEAMHVLPLERELAAWQERLAALTNGSNGPASLHSVATEIERNDAEIDHANRIRERLSSAQSRADQIATELTNIEFQLYVAAAEERELKAKIELAERAARLEGWASELHSAFDSVEKIREEFARLQERLETVQVTVRGLPDDAEDMARKFASLDEHARNLAEKISRDEQAAATLELRLRDLDQALAEDAPSDLSELECALVQKREARLLAEQDLTELSRQRIDLLRQRDGLAMARNERFREFVQLSADEWRSLDEFIASGGDSVRDTADRDELASKIEKLRTRIVSEFAGFDLLPADTHQKIERLFLARMQVSAKEAELIRLQTEAVNHERFAARGGVTTGLTAAGVLGAGLPAGFLLGPDIGFFAAVLGGGAGFALARLLMPSRDGEREADHLKLQTTQNDFAVAEQMRNVLETDLAVLARHSSPEAALHRWSEYLSLRNMLREAEIALEAVVDGPVSTPTLVPALLKRLEVDELRQKVDEYRELTERLMLAERAIANYEAEDGGGPKAKQIDAIAHRLGEEERALDQRLAVARDEFVVRRAQLAAERETAAGQLRSLEVSEHDRKQLELTQAELESLDLQCGGVLRRLGPLAIIEALAVREQLALALRETKAKLSADHTPQELAARADVIEKELAQVTERLQELDPLYAAVGSRTDALEKYGNQVEEAKAQIDGIVLHRDALIAELESLKLEDLVESSKALASEETLQSERAALRARLEELQRSVDAAQNMCAGLKSELEEQCERASTRVMNLLKKTVFDSIGERIASVEFQDPEWIAVLDDGLRRPLRSLSRGIAELVTLCLNAGLLMASEDAEAAPVVWDDVLSQLDDLHLSIARQIIEQLGRKRQVILLTRDPRIRAWGRPVEVMTGLHEPDVLLN